MAGIERHLADELEAIREAGLWRELRRVDSVEANRIKIEGREYLNFSSNDYLCLLYTSPSPRDRQKSRMPSSA